METSKPVTLADQHRARHAAVIGRTGYGKTTLLEHLIFEDFRSHSSAVLIDPHGDLSHRLFDQGSTQPGLRPHRYLGNALRTLIPNGRTLADVQRLFYASEP